MIPERIRSGGSLARLIVVPGFCLYRRAWIDWMILWINDES